MNIFNGQTERIHAISIECGEEEGQLGIEPGSWRGGKTEPGRDPGRERENLLHNLYFSINYAGFKLSQSPNAFS